MKVVIVGGVAGGASAAARLRRLNEKAEIVMLERGKYISFANCGLPYFVGGVIAEREALELQTPESFHARYNVDVRIESEVTAIDRAKKTVTVQCGGKCYEEGYDSLILATGAEPVRPALEGTDCAGVFTLRTIPDAVKIKSHIEKTGAKSAVVVGGGFVGLEMAENLKAAGLDVSIVEAAEQILAPLDIDTACEIQNHIRAAGVGLYLNSPLQRLEQSGKGLKVHLGHSVLDCDLCILALGVRAESALAKNAGLELSARGGIIVSDKMQTSDASIYAVGDAAQTSDFVTERPVMAALAGPANKQGRIAADNICGIESRYGGTQGSFIVKVFGMTAAATGVNEKTAAQLKLDYEKSFTFSANHAGYYPGATNMSVKLVFDKKEGRLLGAQLTGYEGVDKRCDVLATAIRAHLSVFDLATLELCYAPPYSGAKDPVNMAGFVAENILTQKVKTFHWHDIKDVQSKKDVIRLDVRTPREYAAGRIEGFENIPLDTLRGSLHRLDKSKTLYVHCQSGLRSYLACRILTQNGFDCYNLSGGYRLYAAVLRARENAEKFCGSCN